nr:unnamed protein product [Callosobruchus chinensis]
MEILSSCVQQEPAGRSRETLAGKRRERKARKYCSPSNLLTLYKAQIRPSLEYCSYIWGAAAPTTLSILDAVQRRAIRR